MRKFKHLLVVLPLLMGFLFVACDDKEEVIPPYLKVTTVDGNSLTSIAATSAEYKTTFNVESNSKWTVVKDSNVDWLYISPLYGDGSQSVDVTIAENKSAKDRETSFTVKLDGVDETKVKVVQSAGDIVFVATISGDSVVSAKGGSVKFDINTNLTEEEWSYAVTPIPTDVVKSASELIVYVPENTEKEKVVYNVEFKYRDNTLNVSFEQEAVESFVPDIVADLLDVVFNEDGTAVDVSPYGNTVNFFNVSNTVTTEFVQKLNRRVAKFATPAYSTVSSGFYTVEYDKGGDFISKIADGCTFETIFKINREHVSTNGELKWFSSHEAGGIGFLLTSSADQSIAFIVNASTTGASNWCWARSGRTPLVNQYYHVVGVYNKLEGQVYVYINGEFYSKGDAYGEYNPVSSGAEFVAIGGDAVAGSINSRRVQGAINGEVAMARIYSEPLTASQVADLWKAAEFAPDVDVIDIAAEFLPACSVKAGYKYHIYGKGFVAGDKVEFKSGSDVHLLDAEISATKAVVTIPADMTSGTYTITVRRGEKSLTLGSVEVTVTDTPRIVTPKIIAHRGIHNTGQTENSLGSLREALKFNAYGSELDVHLTKDGVVVVHHDGVVSGLAGGKSFQNCTYDEIKDYKLSNGEKLPVLSDMLDLLNEYKSTTQTKLIIEFKQGVEGMNAVDPVLEMVQKANLGDRVEYISFGYDICKYVASKVPGTIVGYLYGTTAPSNVLADGIRSIDYAYNIYHDNPTWIPQAQNLGMVVNVWTVNTNYEMLYFIGKGVDYITTDYPQTLKDLNEKIFITPND